MFFSIPGRLRLPGIDYEEYKKTKIRKAPGGRVCLVCGIHLSASTKLKRHFEERHEVSDVRYFCPACNKNLSSRRNVQKHLKTTHPMLVGIDLSNCTYRYTEDSD